MNEWISQFICVNNCTGDSAVVGGGPKSNSAQGPQKAWAGTAYYHSLQTCRTGAAAQCVYI